MSSTSLAYRVREAASSLRGHFRVVPEVAIVLGSGLGSIADGIDDPVAVSYAEIPNFVPSTAPGHTGQLVAGTLEGVPVVVMRGRIHYYEGYSLQQVTFPMRTLARLGARTLIVTNAAGGVNLTYQTGDFMVFKDHINLMGLAGSNPLIGPDEPELGVRFLDMLDCYDQELRSQALQVAATHSLRAHEGVYAAIGGPSYETRAEVRFLRFGGADAVGMSTVHEVIVARHEMMRVLGISVITNSSSEDTSVSEVSHESVLEVADLATAGLKAIIHGVLRGEGTESAAQNAAE